MTTEYGASREAIAEVEALFGPAGNIEDYWLGTPRYDNTHRTSPHGWRPLEADHRAMRKDEIEEWGPALDAVESLMDPEADRGGGLFIGSPGALHPGADVPGTHGWVDTKPNKTVQYRPGSAGPVIIRRAGDVIDVRGPLAKADAEEVIKRGKTEPRRLNLEESRTAGRNKAIAIGDSSAMERWASSQTTSRIKPVEDQGPADETQSPGDHL